MRGLILGAAFAALSAGAAQAASTIPTQADICVGDAPSSKYVDPKRAVNYFATSANLSWQLASDMADHKSGGAFASAAVWQRLLDPDLCKTDGIACTKDDKAALALIRIRLRAMLKDWGDAFGNPGKLTDPERFVLDGSNKLRCTGQEPPGQPSPKFAYTLPLRVRGSADDLFIDRGQGQFKSLKGASIDLANDETKHVATDKITAVVGYPIIPDRDHAPFFEIVPYIGFNRNVSHTRDKGLTLNTDTADAGVAFATFWTSPFSDRRVGHWLTFRPDYLFDHADHSIIESLNLAYVPVLNGALNDYRPLIGSGDHKLASVEPILELHWNNGWFSQRGTSLTRHYDDYSRLGVKYGAAFTSDNPNLPITWTVTDTELGQLRGGGKTLGYFSSDLSLAFDPKQYFTIGLVYTNGRREDSFAREQSLDLKLSAKY